MIRICLILLLFSNLWGLDNESQIKNYLQNAYQKHYKNYQIHISNIFLNLAPKTSIQDYKIQSIELDSKNLHKKSGTLILNVSIQNSLLKIPLQYQIEATIDIYRSNSAIKKSQDITQNNTFKDQISLDKITQIPITSTQINHVSAKSYIPASSIITQDKIQPQILIHKNDTFIGIIKEAHIKLETTLIAKENGSKGQIINAINPETKKIIRIKVIDSAKGEIL